MSIAMEAARTTISQLRAKLDAAAVEVLASGRNWAEGPMDFECSPLADWQPGAPANESFSVRGGPVDDDWLPPLGWKLVRHADWIRAGRPGLHLLGETRNPTRAE